jgi:hypothetical protein
MATEFHRGLTGDDLHENEPHTHDDRHYTKAEAQIQFAGRAYDDTSTFDRLPGWN